MHLFARTATGELCQRHLRGDAWKPWAVLGHPVAEGSNVSVGADWQLTACSQGPRRLDLFGRSPDGELLQMTWEAGSWDALRCLGAPAVFSGGVAIPMGLASPPAACSPASGRTDVVVLGHDGTLLHTCTDGAVWSEFSSLGAPGTPKRPRPVPITAPPAVCGCGDGRMAVFVRGPLGDLLCLRWDGQSWSDFVSLGMPEVPYDSYPAVGIATAVAGPPAASSWSPDRIDVVVRGPHGSLLHKWWDGQGWSDFTSRGMPTTEDGDRGWLPLTGTVAACSSGTGCLDVFARAVDGALYHCALRELDR